MEIDLVVDGEQRRAGLRTRERQRADVGIKTVRPRYASLVVEEFDCCSGKFAMILKDSGLADNTVGKITESLLLAVEGFDEVGRKGSPRCPSIAGPLRGKNRGRNRNGLLAGHIRLWVRPR